MTFEEATPFLTYSETWYMWCHCPIIHNVLTTEVEEKLSFSSHIYFGLPLQRTAFDEWELLHYQY